MNKRFLAVTGLVLLVVLSGCAQISVNTTVAADGTISEYKMQINMSRSAYGFLDQAAENDGYDDVEDSILSDLNESQREKFSYEEEFQGDMVMMTLTAQDVSPEADSAISITRADGQLVFQDETFLNESAGEASDMSNAMLSGLSVDYYLTMPGEITDTNADSVDGNTAEWHESGPDAFTDMRIYAKSEVPTGIATPGFGVVGMALAMVVAGLLLMGKVRTDR